MEQRNGEVGGPTATGEGRGEVPRSRQKWRLTVAVGAVLALLLATAVSYRSFPKLSISSNICKCPMGGIFFSRVSTILWSNNAIISSISSNFFSCLFPLCFSGKQDARKYSGMVEDCCCDYETVNQLNDEVLHPILQELVKTPFFRYFKVILFPFHLFNVYTKVSFLTSQILYYTTRIW